MGTVEAYERKPITEKKLIGITSVGMAAARYLYHLRPALQARDYEVAVFHATGMSTRLFERVVRDGLLDFVLDLYVGQELMSELFGSLFGPGSHRLEAAGEVGTPQIISTGLIEHCLWGPYKPIPEKYAERIVLHHNPLLWMIFTNTEEKLEVARLMAEKLNRAKGPTAVVLPLKSPLGAKKLGIEHPEGMAAFRKEFKLALKPQVNYVEVDASTDDKEFTDCILTMMDDMMGK
jgi:uncharacterized protein (UPF0261 family)